MRPPRLCESLPELSTPEGGATTGAWPTLLVVDNDPEMLRTLVCYFERRGFHVAAGASLAEARTFFHRHKKWSLVISDFHLDDGTGWELCCWIREQSSAPPPFLLISGSVQREAIDTGLDFLAKPFSVSALDARVQTMLARARA